ncbi:hypothetical protein ACJX0J_029767 [Zea mays]
MRADMKEMKGTKDLPFDTSIFFLYKNNIGPISIPRHTHFEIGATSKLDDYSQLEFDMPVYVQAICQRHLTFAVSSPITRFIVLVRVTWLMRIVYSGYIIYLFSKKTTPSC